MESQVLSGASIDQLEQSLIRSEMVEEGVVADPRSRHGPIEADLAAGESRRQGRLVDQPLRRCDQVGCRLGGDIHARGDPFVHRAASVAGVDLEPHQLGDHRHLVGSNGSDPAHDIAGIRRLAARRRRYSAAGERAAFADQCLTIQPCLGEDRGRFHGELTGVAFAIFDKGLAERADELGLLPDGTRHRGPPHDQPM